MEKYLKLILFVMILSGCQDSIITVPEFEPIASERVVLIEEMTGVSCPNCPKGTAEIEALKSLYGDQVIPVGIHGIFLSWPTPESNYDLRNLFARELENTYAPGTSKPAALFNRAKPANGNSRVIQSSDLWAGMVAEQLAKPPVINLSLELIYNASDTIIEVNAGVVALQDLFQDLNISVMILENHIIDAQEDLNEVIEDFEHNHVLRTMLTPATGESLASGMELNEILTKSYRFKIPRDESLWVVENLEVVVFVHERNVDGEVLQAALAKLD